MSKLPNQIWTAVVVVVVATGCGSDSALHDDPAAGAASERMAQAASRNPFAGAEMYRDATYAAGVEQSLAKVGPTSADAGRIRAAKQLPTAVWLDRIAAIAGDKGKKIPGLSDHLDAAVKQAQDSGRPVAISIVVYDLPERDCKAKASNGELKGKEGLARYKNEFIDVIAKTLVAKPAYKDLRVAIILEPDSLPNLVTNDTLPACQTAVKESIYVDGIAYAIGKFKDIASVSTYLDIGHSGWLGWPANLQKAIGIFHDTVAKADNGNLAVVRGFATNTANYTPLQEPGVKADRLGARAKDFYEWNPVFDEVSYVKALDAAFQQAGFRDLGFITDTSRNGWAARSDEDPIDRRDKRGNWCNVKGTGLGIRPQANPISGVPIDAAVYVKPPGTSDGYSRLQNPENLPDAEGKRYDSDCDPGVATLNAMDGAPGAGAWFHDHFMMLIGSANPALAPVEAGAQSTGQGGAGAAKTPAAAAKPAPASREAAGAGAAPAAKPAPRPAPQPAAAIPPPPSGGDASCAVEVQQDPAWQHGNGFAATVKLWLRSLNGPGPKAPYTVTLLNDAYSEVIHAWSWEARLNGAGKIAGSVSFDWADLKPDSKVDLGLNLVGSSQSLVPSQILINGKPCRIEVKKQ